MLPRLPSRHVSVVVGLEGGLVGAAQHDVPLEGQRPVVLRALQGVPADRPVPCDGRDGVEDRVLAEQRVVREVHLGDQTLGERAAEQAEVDVRGPPGVVVVAPRVGAGLDRHELRSEEHTSELQSRQYLVCRLLLEKNYKTRKATMRTCTANLCRSRHPALPQATIRAKWRLESPSHSLMRHSSPDPIVGPTTTICVY